MPTIQEGIQSGLRWVSENGPTSAAALPVNGSPATNVAPGVPEVNPGATLPTRGTYPPGIILDSDFSDAVGYGMGGNQYIRSRILLAQEARKSKVSPASSQNNAGTNNVNSTNTTGTPAQLSSITVTQENYDATHILLSVAFVPTADPFFGGIQVWLKGYHGSTSPVLVASGDKLSPVSFVVDFTGETVTVIGQAISPSGLTASLGGGPTAQITLNGNFPAPPAPTIVQTTSVIAGGFQFQFQFEGGNLASLIDHYNVYRSQTTNDFRVSRLLTTVAQSSGTETFQDTVSGTAFYFLSAVDTNKHESSILSCQSGQPVVISDNTTHVSTPLNNQGNIPASSQPTSLFTIASAEVTAGKGFNAKITWSSFTNTRADGTTVTIAANPAVPSAPTLSQVAGGSLSGRTDFVAVAYVKNGVIQGISNTNSIVLSANNLMVVASPPANSNMDGWVPFVGTSATTLVAQPNGLGNQSLGGFVSSPIAIGTNWTEPTAGAHLARDLSPLVMSYVAANSAGLNLINLVQSVTYKLYFYYVVKYAVVLLANDGSNSVFTSASPAAASQQSGDGNVALSAGAVSFTTPTSGSTGSATGGGGGGGGRGLE